MWQCTAPLYRSACIPTTPLQVHETFREIAVLVDEQGKQLDTVETNVIDAHASTETGVGHLVKAASYQKTYGRCILIFVLILVLVAAGVGGYFGYKAKDNGGK
jgi:t-SNARE complex subunit (syntaxin)